MEGKEASMASLSVRVAHTRRFVAAREAAPQQAVALLTGLMHDMVWLMVVKQVGVSIIACV